MVALIGQIKKKQQGDNTLLPPFPSSHLQPVGPPSVEAFQRTGPSQSGTSELVSWHHSYISLLTVIAHGQQRPVVVHRGSNLTA